MKLSVKSEYACLGMIELSKCYGSGLVKIEKIAKKEKIPQRFLEQIFLSLKNAGLLKSRRGKAGGYELAKPPEKISVAEVVRLMDGALAPVASVSTYFYSHGPSEQNRQLTRLLKEIREMVSTKMEKTTFKDLIQD